LIYDKFTLFGQTISLLFIPKISTAKIDAFNAMLE